MNRIDSILDSHGGGSWKIAFADFAMAMMAVFLVLWMTAVLDQEQKVVVAQYFLNPDKVKDFIPADEVKKKTLEAEAEPEPLPAPQELVLPLIEQEQVPQEPIALSPVELLMEKIQQSPALQEYSEEVVLSMHALGLKIQIMDSVNQAMFTLGDTQLTAASDLVLAELAPLLNATEHRISISGHTDSLAFPDDFATDNWTLSLNRADSARHSLLKAGLQADKIAEIVGMGDSLPYDAENPEAAINRRIAIIVLNKDVDESMMKARSGH
ncbi:OmpA family protein [Thalassomonas actiniarum]|uniref:OmpA family protein n=1 Tax=Thalassomonas actiniarum TaxID=485447 RepID=A0AAF0C6N8_9GAMM|nr:OmpA family protein [Thalassomonas actiniarum]WDE02506.1 OmpA family protein [Thalassomonas actiniarum]